MRKKITKSYQGYINNKKKSSYLYAMVILIGILGIFSVGIYLTGTRLNWLTIVAVFFCLPFAKALVAAIIITPYKSVDKEFASKVNDISYPNEVYYELILNDEKKFYNIDAIVISKKEIIGYVSNAKTDLKQAENLIKIILKSENISGYVVNLKKDLEAFYKKIDNNIDKDLKSNNDEEVSKIFNLFKSLSL